jgi:LDH2 family malate/lactate/ureidoglycolate dehydrogenase
MSDYVQLDVEKVSEFCVTLFESYGFTRDESRTITDVLIRADQYGIESHGVQRLMRYHKEMFSFVNVHAQPEILYETGISAVWDACKAMGHVVADSAMKRAIEKAKKNGFGIVTVRNSNHYGIAGYYSSMAAELDLIGVCMTNTEAIGVPTYGKEAMLGTNPIAFAMPADPYPFSYDGATSVVPRGKLEVYEKNEKPMPEQWAVDASGKPCSNAAEVLRNITEKLGGGIAPIGGSSELLGGHKGYGLAVIVDIFTAILSGGLTSPHINVTKGVNGICHCFMAIDYGIFGEKSAIKKNMSVFLQELRDSDKAEGQNRIFIHGEREREAKAGRFSSAIPVNVKTLDEMRVIAKDRNIKYPF